MTQSDLPPPPLPPPPGPPRTQPAVDLDQPSRTSPLTVALELIGLVGLGSGLVLGILAGMGAEILQLWVGLVVILVRLAGWWFRTYTVTSGELVLDEGMLQKHHRVVPFSRIQQVELRQQLMARALGIATVHIETAADAGGTAVTLRSLELHHAEALRDHLLAEQRRVRAGVVPGGTTLSPTSGLPLPVRTPLVRLGPGDLLLAGATSAGVVTVGIVVMVAAAVGGVVTADAQDLGPLVAALLFLVLCGSGIAATAGLAAVGTLVSAWGYELSAAGDDLHLEQGLFDRRQHTMPRHRLQHARVIDNPLRRALGTSSVQLHSAASPGRSDEQRSYIDIPLVRAHGLGDLLVTLMGSDDFRPPPLARRPRAARRRAVMRRTLATALVAVPLAAATWPAGAGILPLALVGVPWGLAAHRRAGSALEGRVLALSAGVLARRLELVPVARLQSARTSANPLQRRAGLASLHLDVAGNRLPLLAGGPGLADLDAAVAATTRARVTVP